MKSILIALALVLSVGVTAEAAPKKKKTRMERLCDTFRARENLECAHIMCDEEIKAGTWKDLDECTEADDYGEAASEGCYEQKNSVENLVKRYNKTHRTKAHCDE